MKVYLTIYFQADVIWCYGTFKFCRLRIAEDSLGILEKIGKIFGIAFLFVIYFIINPP